MHTKLFWYIVLLGPFGSDPLYFGDVGSITDLIALKGEAFYGTPSVDDLGGVPAT